MKKIINHNKIIIKSSLVLQTIYSAIVFSSVPKSLSASISLSAIPFYVYIIGFLFGPILFAIQEINKTSDVKEFATFQKRSKLLFNTKLGMHSPV